MHALRWPAAVVTVMSAASGLVAVSAAPPEAAPTRVAVQLTADGDLANVPLNLLYTLINIPANALKAVDAFSYSQFFSGPWFVPSETNIWGIDLGDPPRIQALIDMLIPIPALSKPLGEQVIGLLQAQLPTNTACDSMFCSFDGWVALLQGYGQVPISELRSGYTFPTEGPTITDPHGAVEGAFGIPGTVIGSDGSDVYPWAGTTFTLDFGKPWADLWASLTADPSDNPLVPMPHLVQVLIDFAASWYVMLNPFLPGGTYTPIFPWLDTDGPEPADFSAPVEALVDQLGDLWTSLIS
ncbi:hypothetical protein [Mycolicibacter arupensis]|jgi:hypothetical protein|nr:hypothetical protein [Mycolicibacter arupensis]MCV7276781.1 hypothetical protein [Mycolicibacter arupensis]